MIDKEEFEKASFEEKQKFIKKILKLATHNSFTKDNLLLLIKWQNAIIEKTKCCANCTHFRGYNEYTDNVYYACELEECDNLDRWGLAE